MKIPEPIRRKANEIANRYSGFHFPGEIPGMYDELREIGITVPCFSSAYTNNHEYEFNGETVENSYFRYSVYKPENSSRYDFTMYFS